MVASSPERLRVAAFASGSGTNLQALLDRQTPDSSWRIELVVSDRPGAGALERAARAGVAAVTIPVKDRPHEEVSAETIEALRRHEIDVMVLAGYLRLVPAEVVAAYRGLILNIHPALLPSFGGPGMYGMHVHRAVVEAGCRVTGVTVHIVDEEYDQGPILAQWPVPVHPGDTPEALAVRVLGVEHRLYAAVLDHVCRQVLRGEEPGPVPFVGDDFEII